MCVLEEIERNGPISLGELAQRRSLSGLGKDAIRIETAALIASGILGTEQTMEGIILYKKKEYSMKDEITAATVYFADGKQFKSREDAEKHLAVPEKVLIEFFEDSKVAKKSRGIAAKYIREFAWFEKTKGQ